MTQQEIEAKIAELEAKRKEYAEAGLSTIGFDNNLAALKGELRTITEQQAAAGQRNDVIAALDRVAKGYGTAYGTTMNQVSQGNQRIAALAASGRGGLNAGVNSQNAQAMNNSAGRQQAEAAKAAEMSQARGALGQAIAAGQDYNAAEGQATLEALRNTPAAAPNQAMQTAGQIGAAGQAIWSANQGNQQNPNDANRKRNW